MLFGSPRLTRSVHALASQSQSTARLIKQRGVQDSCSSFDGNVLRGGCTLGVLPSTPVKASNCPCASIGAARITSSSTSSRARIVSFVCLWCVCPISFSLLARATIVIPQWPLSQCRPAIEVPLRLGVPLCWSSLKLPVTSNGPRPGGRRQVLQTEPASGQCHDTRLAPESPAAASPLGTRRGLGRRWQAASGCCQRGHGWGSEVGGGGGGLLVGPWPGLPPAAAPAGRTGRWVYAAKGT